MPRRTRSHRASSAPAVPQNSGNNGRSPLEPKDLCVGCIVWLPSRVESDGGIKCNKQNCCDGGLDNDAYDHPVVIVNIRQREGSYIKGDLICTVACVTTYGNTSLSKYISSRPRTRHFQLSIPICDADAEATDTTGHSLVEQLHLEKGSLRKQSYVKFQHTYGVPVSTLRHYHFRKPHNQQAYKIRLSQKSYDLLMVSLGVDAETYIATKVVARNGESQLALLALSGGRPRRTHTVPSRSSRPQYVPSYSQPAPTTYGAVSPAPRRYPTQSIPRPYDYNPPSSTYEDDSGSGPGVVTCLVGIIVIGGLLWWHFW
ncbi:hypothetical protein EG329_008735 [Mollisiaceae sp. DMI_Dod_QoI]|nr:hypothetical protein EG329_008735 [Helotiales sp. DMI_Dod_QoI]